MDKLKQAAHAFHDKVGPSDDMAPPPGQDRAQNKPVDPPNPSDQRTSAASSSGTAFDQSKVKVVYVLGGCGAHTSESSSSRQSGSWQGLELPAPRRRLRLRPSLRCACFVLVALALRRRHRDGCPLAQAE